MPWLTWSNWQNMVWAQHFHWFFPLSLIAFSVWVPTFPMHSISGREGNCTRASTVGCRTQELPFPLPSTTAHWLLPGDSSKRDSKSKREREYKRGRLCLYLRLWSDYFSPAPSPAERSLPGWGPVERFSPQIFGNKVRYGDCARGSSPWGNWDSITIYLGIYRPFCSSVPR